MYVLLSIAEAGVVRQFLEKGTGLKLLIPSVGVWSVSDQFPLTLQPLASALSKCTYY